MSTELPDHLGGHLNKTHIDVGALEFFKNEIGCTSMLDIGCGPGGQVEKAVELGYYALGLDGDYTLSRENLRGDYQLIDFTKETFDPTYDFDLGWSCEFVEHVEEKYIDNFIPAFKACKFVCMTYCPPQSTKNPHHFNEQPEEYWVKLFESHGFIYNKQLTDTVRLLSTQQKPFVRSRGLVFINGND